MIVCTILTGSDLNSSGWFFLKCRPILLIHYITLCFAPLFTFWNYGFLREKFSLRKLCAALQRKDYREVERKQNKMGIQMFLARRGIGHCKPVAIVRPVPRRP